MGAYDHCKTQGELAAAHKARMDCIQENYRSNIRKIDEELAEKNAKRDAEMRAFLPWGYMIGCAALVWGVVMASGGLFNR
jgi:hypothetical protein